MKDNIFACPRCKQPLKIASEAVGQDIECPTCKLDFTIPTTPPLSQQKRLSQTKSASHRKMPKVIKKRQTSAAGLLLELIGFAMLFFWNVNPIISMIGVGLLIAGISMAKKFVCSECGNKVEDKNVKMCPVCKAEFKTK